MSGLGFFNAGDADDVAVISFEVAVEARQIGEVHESILGVRRRKRSSITIYEFFNAEFAEERRSQRITR